MRWRKAEFSCYLDFYVVEGGSGEYIVEEVFRTCSDFIFRGGSCWHILAVKIARCTGGDVPVHPRYQEKMDGKQTPLINSLLSFRNRIFWYHVVQNAGKMNIGWNILRTQGLIRKKQCRKCGETLSGSLTRTRRFAVIRPARHIILS